MTTVCSRPCKYRKAVFCGLTFTMLNQFGQCLVWFDKNGNVRMAPDYRYDAPPEQDDVREKKQTSSDNSEKPTEKSKDDEPKIENTEGDNGAREQI